MEERKSESNEPDGENGESDLDQRAPSPEV